MVTEATNVTMYVEERPKEWNGASILDAAPLEEELILETEEVFEEDESLLVVPLDPVADDSLLSLVVALEPDLEVVLELFPEL